ncbi:hypothetical protein N0V83_005246 [Neocucurbitaria cava]|uniref:Heterokaryon incompatibility domain-containing protein n=1 Tax=Neocucurbitaria cava TaxID=798079 RepID=A0A9W9CN00_9PLEO|nr:hypothetical protein N0V83_005246 [Neocucurbitaria cava]
MEGQRSTYTYSPLNEAHREIRLLHLLPKQRKTTHSGVEHARELEDIRCTFSLASLNDHPPFEALSYVWGDPKAVIPISLHGHEFPVTLNLHDALSNLRLDCEERILWADALCINQADNDVVFQFGQRARDASIIRDFADDMYRHAGECCRCTPYLRFENSSGVSVSGGIARFKRLTKSHENKDGLDLLSLMGGNSTRECYDPRDKIFGLLGLCGYPGDYRPDYSKSVRQVYEDFVVSQIREAQSLDILSYGYGARHRNLRLPSFVPDWTATLPHDSSLDAKQRYKIVRMGTFNAADCSKEEINIFHPGMGVTRAIAVDTIVDFDHLHGARSLKQEKILERHRRLAKVDDRTQVPYTSRIAALWKTWWGGITLQMNNARVTVSRIDDLDGSNYQQWQKGLFWDVSQKNVDPFYKIAFNYVSAGRKFIVTKMGYMGFAPESCEKGDLIVLMPGGKVPYILRPASEADEIPFTDWTPGNRFTFLGDAYLQGIMHGEAYDEERLELIALV